MLNSKDEELIEQLNSAIAECKEQQMVLDHKLRAIQNGQVKLAEQLQKQKVK